MNDTVLNELKIVVERAVRPVRATMARKRKMREELLAHLVSIFEEEVGKLGNEQAALEQAKQRFGDPKELTPELQGSVSRWEQMGFLVERYNFQPWEPVRRLAVMSVLCMGLTTAAMLAAGVIICVLRGRTSELGMISHVSLVMGVVITGFMFGFIFLSERMGQAVFGAETDRSVWKAVLYGLASLAVFPVQTFVAHWASSFDLAASLAHLRLACYFAPATPLIFLLMGRQMMKEIRQHQEWASLEIGE